MIAAPGAVAPVAGARLRPDAARRDATGCAPTSTTARARRPRAWPTSAAGCGRRAWSSRCWRAPAIASSCARSRRPTPSAAASCSTPRPGATAAATTRSRAWSACAAASRSPRPSRPRRRRRRPQDAPAPLPDSALALEERLRAAGHEPPNAADLEADDLAALRAAGRAVRVGRAMYAHPEALAAVRARVEAVVAAEGAITLARLRDELQTSRKFAQAHLEHLDAERVTKRLPGRLARAAPRIKKPGASPTTGG